MANYYLFETKGVISMEYFFVLHKCFMYISQLCVSNVFNFWLRRNWGGFFELLVSFIVGYSNLFAKHYKNKRLRE